MRPRLVQVSGVDRITPRTVRITLRGADIVPATPDAYVKLFFPLPGQPAPELAPPVTGDVVSWYRGYLAMPDGVRPPMRTYTVRAHRPGSAEIDVDFVLHDGAGPASSWAMSAKPGDTIAFLGPTGVHNVPNGIRWQLLVGDETAVPAIASIIESAPSGAVLRAFLEVPDPRERQRFASAADVEVHWVDDVLEAVRSKRFDPGVYAWLAGEASMVRAVRRHLVHDRGIDKRAVTFTGYWRKGMSEEDVGREGLRRISAGLDPESW